MSETHSTVSSNNGNNRIAVVVPTIRPDMWYGEFIPAWQDMFTKYEVLLLRVEDGEEPRVDIIDFAKSKIQLDGEQIDSSSFLTADEELYLFVNFSPAVRNMGFAAISKFFPEVKYIITLDDDVKPWIVGKIDTIFAHCCVLELETSTSWMNTLGQPFWPRGFPYTLRKENPIMLSHGVWSNVLDWDAPTQLMDNYGLGLMSDTSNIAFLRCAVPKGIYAPFCGMNLAFRRELLPYAYWAPTVRLRGCERFDDIWAGIHIKDTCDENGWACVTGYSIVEHNRASDPIKNLAKEAVGIDVNETYWLNHGQPNESDSKEVADWKISYAELRKLWFRLITGWEAQHST